MAKFGLYENAKKVMDKKYREFKPYIATHAEKQLILSILDMSFIEEFRLIKQSKESKDKSKIIIIPNKLIKT